jgi:hypothetical protein
MWIQLNNAMFSIVEHHTFPDLLQVRARFKGDIEAVFGVSNGVVMETPESDYMYRIFVPREVVSSVIANEINNINYTNFKNSVEEDWRHDLYTKIWTAGFNEQEKQHPFTSPWYTNYRNYPVEKGYTAYNDLEEDEYVLQEDLENLTSYATEDYVDERLDEVFDYINTIFGKMKNKIKTFEKDKK